MVLSVPQKAQVWQVLSSRQHAGMLGAMLMAAAGAAGCHRARSARRVGAHVAKMPRQASAERRSRKAAARAVPVRALHQSMKVVIIL